MNLNQAIELIQGFQGQSLKDNLSCIESDIIGLGAERLGGFCENRGINDLLMASALSIKQIAGQINVIIHAAGILGSLPRILEPGEVVENVSLGAGNTGRKFDLETNRRVAEYKFIDWKGGAESIRQNGIFKDFFELAEYETEKRKFLYVVGTNHALRFLQSGRTLNSILSKQPEILKRISQKYGTAMAKVRDYYALKKTEVTVCDISPHIGRNTDILSALTPSRA
jgi:hypothetical protein